MRLQLRWSSAAATSTAPAHGAAPTPQNGAPSASAHSQQYDDAEFQKFVEAARSGANLVPLSARIFSDHLTPVLAYR